MGAGVGQGAPRHRQLCPYRLTPPAACRAGPAQRPDRLTAWVIPADACVMLLISNRAMQRQRVPGIRAVQVGFGVLVGCRVAMPVAVLMTVATLVGVFIGVSVAVLVGVFVGVLVGIPPQLG